MSKDISIKKDGTPWITTNVPNIKVRSDAGSVTLIPEDESKQGYIRGKIDGEEYTVTKDGLGRLVYTRADEDIAKNMFMAVKEGGKDYVFKSEAVITMLKSGLKQRWVPDVHAVDSLTGVGDDGYKYTLTNDSNGNIVQTRLPLENPVYITVVQGPDLDTYNIGDTIEDFTGIVVRAFDSDGNVWANPNYPDGLIPFSELSFGRTTVKGIDGTFISYPSREEEYQEYMIWPFENQTYMKQKEIENEYQAEETEVTVENTDVKACGYYEIFENQGHYRIAICAIEVDKPLAKVHFKRTRYNMSREEVLYEGDFNIDTEVRVGTIDMRHMRAKALYFAERIASGDSDNTFEYENYIQFTQHIPGSNWGLAEYAPNMAWAMIHGLNAHWFKVTWRHCSTFGRVTVV